MLQDFGPDDFRNLQRTEVGQEIEAIELVQVDERAGVADDRPSHSP
jgi:hypothetical protein